VNVGDDWRTEAACRDDPRPGDWFSSVLAEAIRATRVCSTCAVIRECAWAAEAEAERYGVWGGQQRDPDVQKALDRQAAAQAQVEAEAAARRERQRLKAQARRDRLRADPAAYEAYIAKERARVAAARAAETPAQYRLRIAKQSRYVAARDAS
jgi:hypothetical protein